jgi:NADPH:quinone reductase-like Zn-dependent oxidoreductase
MHAITVNEYGAAPAPTDVPDPHSGPGQVLIRIEAAGVNPMDRAIADGGWKAMMPATFPPVTPTASRPSPHSYARAARLSPREMSRTPKRSPRGRSPARTSR